MKIEEGGNRLAAELQEVELVYGIFLGWFSNWFEQLLFRALAEEQISLSKAAALSNQPLAEFKKQQMSF